MSEVDVSNSIHPSAVVSPLASLGKGISIGPFCVIEDHVTLGDGCQLASHVVIKRGTTLGTGNEIADHVVLGSAPQHAKVGKCYGRAKIGNGNRFREGVTVHAAIDEAHETLVGDQNFFMVNAHVGHDCVVGSHVIVVNNVMLGGHALIGDRAYLGGGSGVHQFCRVGRLAMVGAQAHIVQDVPPFVTVDGATNRVVGLNRLGLRRAGCSDEELLQLKQAYRIIYRSAMTWSEAIVALAETFHSGPATEFAPFLKLGKRGYVQERRLPRGATLKLPSTDEREFIDNRLRKVG